MTQKWIEIRDAATFIPALAIRLTGGEHWLARASGFGADTPYVLLFNLARIQAEYDPYSWGPARTMAVAHQWLIEHWDEQVDGGVLDVEFLLGERDAPKDSERAVRV